MTSNKVLECNYSQARTISRKINYYDPEGNEVVKTHFLFILLKDLPKNIPTTPNPRQPDINAKPCKQMRNTLETKPEHFTDCNRGLLLAAEKVYYPNSNEPNQKVIIDFGVDEDDNPKGGLVDGGHTYAVLKQYLDDESLSDLPIFITIIEGAEEFATELARARNTSVQVADKSIANLENEFLPIKNSLGDYSDKLIFFENENLANEKAVFPVEDLIAILTALNIELYDNNHQPTIAYTGVSTCLNKWLNKKTRKSYEPLYPLVRSIVELYEYLYYKFEEYAEINGGIGSKKFGLINGIEVNRGRGDKKKPVSIKLPFSEKTVRYQLSKGFILPIFASLRFLLENDGTTGYYWSVDPKIFLDKYAPQLIGQIFETHTREYAGNPNKTGKSKVLWENIAKTVIIYSLQEKLAKK